MLNYATDVVTYHPRGVFYTVNEGMLALKEALLCYDFVVVGNILNLYPVQVKKGLSICAMFL